MGDKVPTVQPFAAALGLYRALSTGAPLAVGVGRAAESEDVTEPGDPVSGGLTGERGFVSQRVSTRGPDSTRRVTRWRRGFVRWLVEIEDSDVLAALALAADGRDAATKTARRRAINDATRDVAAMLGNTPAVARRAYIDPRIFDRYLSGWTIRSTPVGLNGFDEVNERKRRRVERAVLDLLSEASEPHARRF